jgi:hypothetical protein
MESEQIKERMLLWASCVIPSGNEDRSAGYLVCRPGQRPSLCVSANAPNNAMSMGPMPPVQRHSRYECVHDEGEAQHRQHSSRHHPVGQRGLHKTRLR